VVSVVRRVGKNGVRRTLNEACFAENLPTCELFAGEVDFDSGGKSVPHVRHDSLPIKEHVCSAQFTADKVVDHEAGDIAVALSGIGLGPAVVGIDSVRTPTRSDRLFELCKRVRDASTVPTSIEAPPYSRLRQCALARLVFVPGA
jgi:hypothetical protein